MFGGDSNKQPAFGLGNTAPGAQQSGFSFNSPTATGTTFGTPATQPQATGFSFGGNTASFGSPSTSLFGSSTVGAAGGAPTTVAPFGSATNTVAPFGSATTSVAPFGSGTPSIFGSTAQSSSGFGFAGTNPQSAVGFPAFGGTAAAPAASTATPSIGLGSTAFATPSATPSVTGFGAAFGQKPAATSAPFSFGSQPGFGATTTAPQTAATTPLGSAGFAPGMQFGTANTSFNLGGTPTTTTAAATSATTPFMGFGQSLTSSAPSTQTTSLQTGSLLAQSLSTPAATIAFPTPLTSSTPAPTAPLSAFGATPTATPTGGITFGMPATTTKPTGFGITSAAPTTSLTFGSTLTTTSTAAPATVGTTGPTTGFSFGGTPAKTTATGFSLGTVPTSTVATTAPLSLASTTAGQSLLVSSAPSTTTTQAAVQAATAAVPPAPSNTPAPFAGASINFRKLEEDINKWTSELEEQERIFLTQATQVNAWDRVLIANGEKITQLNDALERVKLDQEHLDTEVDFIEGQQRELEELLAPLEKSVESLPNLSIHQHADLEREQTFQMAENIDGQLRQMSKDLKEIIEHINTTAGTQDTNDPIYQISKILNAHMDSLQWIDQNSAQLQKKVEEVGQLYEMRRQDHQRGVQLPF